jgi:hypothetical protein
MWHYNNTEIGRVFFTKVYRAADCGQIASSQCEKIVFILFMICTVCSFVFGSVSVNIQSAAT